MAGNTKPTLGERWSEHDVFHLRAAVFVGDKVDDIADFLCRTSDEVREKMRQIGVRENDRTKST